MRDIKNWLLGLLASLIIGLAAYGVNRVEQIATDVTQIKIWQAEINTAAGYDKESYADFSVKFDGLGGDLRVMKETMIKTWDKILDMQKQSDERWLESEKRWQEVEARLRRLESEIENLKIAVRGR